MPKLSFSFFTGSENNLLVLHYQYDTIVFLNSNNAYVCRIKRTSFFLFSTMFQRFVWALSPGFLYKMAADERRDTEIELKWSRSSRRLVGCRYSATGRVEPSHRRPCWNFTWCPKGLKKLLTSSPILRDINKGQGKVVL